MMRLVITLTNQTSAHITYSIPDEVMQPPSFPLMPESANMINLNEGDRGVCVNGVQVTAIVFDVHLALV